MNNLIDIESGQIRLEDNLFSYKMTFEEALSLSKSFKIETFDYNNGYKWINLNEIELNGEYFYFRFCFKSDLLDTIDFGFSSLKKLKRTWSDWTNASELSKQELYEKWLTDNLSPKRNFEWGNIETYYDPKRGTAGITVKFT